MGSTPFSLRFRSIQFSSHGYDRTQQSQCQIGGSIISFSISFVFFFSLSIFFDSDHVLTLFFASGSSRGHGCWEIQPRFALCQGSISRISGCFSNLLFDFVVLIGDFFEFYWVVVYDENMTEFHVFHHGCVLSSANLCWFGCEIGRSVMGFCCFKWIFVKDYYRECEEFRLVTTWFDHGGYDGSD